VGGSEPAGYLTLNLAIHGAVTALAFVVLLQLGCGLYGATAGALLFGLHPVHSEVINFVSARSESLAAGFILLSFAAYLKATQPGESPLAICSERYRTLSVLALGMGLLCKATAIALPAILICYARLRHRSSWSWSDLARSQLAHWAVSAVYVATYLFLSPQSVSRASEVRSAISQMATQAKALLHYIKLAVMPTELTIYHQFFISDSLTAWAPALGLLAGLSLAVPFVVLCRRNWLAAFGGAWFLLALLPTLAVPLNLAVNDHRLYLALLGPVVSLVALAKNQRFTGWIAVVCILFAVLSARQDRVWEDELSLWAHAVERAPLMPEAHYNLAVEHHEAGDLQSARHAYEVAVELDSTYGEAQANLASIYRANGQLEKAESSLRAALAAKPDLPGALNSLGLLLMDRGQLERAEQVFLQILATDSEVAEAHFNLGLIYRDMRMPDRAVRHLSRALELKPELKQTTVGAKRDSTGL
jgi:Tfp pilus assembly protein PilF